MRGGTKFARPALSGAGSGRTRIGAVGRAGAVGRRVFTAAEVGGRRQVEDGRVAPEEPQVAGRPALQVEPLPSLACALP